MKSVGLGIIVIIVSLIGFTNSTNGQSSIIDVHQNVVDAFNAHDMDAMLSQTTDDFVFEACWLTDILDGQEYKIYMDTLFEAYPDEAFLDGLIFYTDDFIVKEHGIQGTHMKEYFGIPPTGKKADPWMHIDVFELDGLKIKKLWGYGDIQTVFVEGGVMPAPEYPPFIPSFDTPAPEATGLSPMDANTEALSRFNARDPQSWIKMVAEGADLFIGVLRQPLTRTELAAILEIHFAGFPDMNVETVRTVDLGDGWVLTQNNVTATHTGTWFGIPPTGKLSVIQEAYIMRFNSDGLITYYHSYYDNLTVLTNLGLLGETSSSQNWELFE